MAYDPYKLSTEERTKALVLQRKIAEAHDYARKLYDECRRKSSNWITSEIGDISMMLENPRRRIDAFVKQ